MPSKRKSTPDKPHESRDLEKDIERANRNPISQESIQQDQGGHFGGQYEKGRPFNPVEER